MTNKRYLVRFCLTKLFD